MHLFLFIFLSAGMAGAFAPIVARPWATSKRHGFFDDLENILDDFTSKKLGNGQQYYGKRKSSFYGEVDAEGSQEYGEYRGFGYSQPSKIAAMEAKLAAAEAVVEMVDDEEDADGMAAAAADAAVQAARAAAADAAADAAAAADALVEAERRADAAAAVAAQAAEQNGGSE